MRKDTFGKLVRKSREEIRFYLMRAGVKKGLSKIGCPICNSHSFGIEMSAGSFTGKHLYSAECSGCGAQAITGTTGEESATAALYRILLRRTEKDNG